MAAGKLSLYQANRGFKKTTGYGAGEVGRTRGTKGAIADCPVTSHFRRYAMATTVDDRRETVSLIGSDKVDGTAVYGADDNRIGSVQRVMIDKISGKVAYAVISFGGFLGM